MTWARLKNTSKLPIRLRSHDRDSVRLFPKKETLVDPKFLWQLPQEVLLLDHHHSITKTGAPKVQKVAKPAPKADK